jgi:class 3 adenylate cyclase
MSATSIKTRPAPSTPLVVLYADISGSTRLYEKYGNAVAQEAITACLDLLSEVVESAGGRVVKYIGDEVQCLFNDPVKAMIAGTDMQVTIQQAGGNGRFSTGPMRIKVGLHFGPAFEAGKEVEGEAAAIAQEITQRAKPDQVLTSESTLNAVPKALQVGARHVERVYLKGRNLSLEIYELIWDDMSITQEAQFKPSIQNSGYSRLVLSYGKKKFELSDENHSLKLGRVKSNDVVVPSELTSRMHAEMSFRGGRCYITDVSINGTLVTQDGGRSTRLKRERLALEGVGEICLGGTPEVNPEGVLTYQCVI